MIFGQGGKFGGFDLFILGVFNQGGSERGSLTTGGHFGHFLEKFVILTPTSGVRLQ